MPRSVGELVELLDLEQIEDNLFRGGQPDTAVQRVFGGQVAAHALIAAHRTVDASYAVHSLHSYFLRPGDPRVPIIYDVEDIREGRSFATRRVMARQHGKPIYYQTLNFQVAEDGFEHQDAMPTVPAPDDCPSLAEALGAPGGRSEEWEREWAALDARMVGDSTGRVSVVEDAGRPARSQLWIRISGTLPDDPLVHLASFTYASDLTLLASTLVPHGVPLMGPQVQAASLDHTIWFHRPFRADEWWLYDQHAPFAGGGRGLALGRIFTQDGTLVATVAQEGLIRRVG
ncbi:acyl-CoA thioesterase [Nocardioides massiliensis]|uniref:Acyl-CoA thioesterase-2 n=1 Tax=Nocardioides massiliensis TaxID=1325935 RepID=A0ABT9NS23_9ACTN|nr:acyl-CoA thioesterase II [Nocardioides massiliensis]MDP9823222.1 acyl-CoA thioesterase-2 [Nocardioides massiliensis]